MYVLSGDEPRLCTYKLGVAGADLFGLFFEENDDEEVGAIVTIRGEIIGEVAGRL
jgi:hypothetical protein